MPYIGGDSEYLLSGYVNERSYSYITESPLREGKGRGGMETRIYNVVKK